MSGRLTFKVNFWFEQQVPLGFTVLLPDGLCVCWEFYCTRVNNTLCRSQTQKVLPLPPPQWVTKCSWNTIFSAFYLFSVTLHVTETSARGCPWRSARCSPAGGVAPRLRRAICPASCDLWQGVWLVRPATLHLAPPSPSLAPRTGSLRLWILTCFMNSH